MSNSGIPEYMLEFSSSLREEEEPYFEVDSVLNMNYNGLMVALKDRRFLILEQEKHPEGYKGAAFQKYRMHNVSKLIEKLSEGENLKEAKRYAYSRGADTPDRMETFLEDGVLKEEYREPFRKIAEDWMPDANPKIDEQAENYIEHLFEQEKHDMNRVMELVHKTYGMSEETAKSRYRGVKQRLMDNQY